MNKSIKKLIATAMMLTLALGTLAGCKGSSTTATTNNDANKQITLKVWHQWSNDSNELKKVYDDAVKAYMVKNPNIKIETDTLDTDAYKTKINTAFASNNADVDVFYYWGAGMAKKLAKSDKLLAIDDYINDGTKDKLQPGSTSAFSFDGKTYSLPMFSWDMVLYCNKDIFDKNGVKIPETYDDLLTASKQLSAKGVLPISLGSKDAWNSCFVYEAFALRAVGATKINAWLAGKGDFSDPGFADAAAKVQELQKAGAFGKNYMGTSHDEADSAYVTGKAAMRLMGSWYANNIWTGKDSIQSVKDNTVAAKLPMITGKGSSTEFAGGFIESFWVNKGTKNPKQAVDFMKYINEQVGDAAAVTSSGFSGWKDNIDTSKWNPIFKSIASQTSTSTASVLAWDTALQGADAQTHYDAVQSLIGGKSTPEDFVKAHQDITNK
jgi:raffinose/stachyose/melibiose transport system substrate-binding protein